MKINKDFLKEAGIFLLFVLGFWLISAMYLKPVFDDKVLIQGDMQQSRLMQHKLTEYAQTTGHNAGWFDGMFSGMPSNLILGNPGGNLIYSLGVIEAFHMVKTPLNFLFVAMLAMFIMLLAAGVNRWLAAAGAIGYAFMTFSITSYEAGHITKVMAMAAMPGVMGGLLLLNRKKYILGVAVAGVFFSALIAYFHYQIAYYTGITAGLFVLIEVIAAVRRKDTRHGVILAGLSLVFVGLSALTSIGKMLDTAQYANATMRGGSEVAEKTAGNKMQSQVSKKGLDEDYAFAWSYGITESYSLFIPRFMGGSSREDIGENELTGEEPLQGLYWGNLRFTSGPIYIGAIFIFLFVLASISVFYLKKIRPDDPDQSIFKGIFWFSAIATLLSAMLAWGKYFPLNSFLFDYLPYYNKFRTPMMAYTIAQVVVPFFGLYGLSMLLKAKLTQEELKPLMKKLLIGLGVLLGLAMLILLFADFSGSVDAELRKNGIQGEAMEKLKSIRSSVAWSDTFRSLVLCGLVLGLVYFTLREKIKSIVLYIGLIVLVSYDMIGVSKRYLNDGNWQEKDVEVAIEPSEADQALMKVNKDLSRVYDFRSDPFNDAHSAPWHRGIGGYHPAKLSRYQDLISYCITANDGGSSDGITNNNALDMLNCGWVLYRDQKSGKEQIAPRPTNLGNAWFVSHVIQVPSAKLALQTINKCKIGDEAVVESSEKLKPASETYQKDSTASIKVSHYSLDTIQYASDNANAGLAVFSEIYYNQKNGSWKATIDGKPAEVLRVNYTLRGLEVPAGKHKIEFIFDAKGNPWLGVEKASSGLLLLLLIGGLLIPALGLRIGKKADA